MKPLLVRLLSDRAVRSLLPLPLVLASCVQLPEPTPAGVVLAPLFSHNMVLQQGIPNVIWGSGNPGQPIWVRFKGLTATGKVTRSGTWEVRLDLADTRQTPYPDNLLVGVGKPGLNLAAALTNVAVGNVWLLGVCDGKGLPLQARDSLTWNGRKTRFLTLSNLGSLRESPTTVATSWQPCAPDIPELRELSAFSFYMSFGLGDGYVGIIQTSTNELARGLTPLPAAEALRSERVDEVRLGLQGAWIMASNEVWQVAESRKALLDHFKQMGIVTNLPPVFQYDFPSVYPRAAFSPTQPPASLVSFEGAIW